MLKKFLSILFFASFAALWGVAVGVEQSNITIGQAVLCLVLDTVIIAVSGFGSGMLTIPDYINHMMKSTKEKRA